MKIFPLDKSELSSILKELPYWSLDNSSAIRRLFKFERYRSAVEFLNIIVDLSEEMNHHPDIILKYSSLEIILFTHSVNALTALDIELASGIENAFTAFSRLKQ